MPVMVMFDVASEEEEGVKATMPASAVNLAPTCKNRGQDLVASCGSNRGVSNGALARAYVDADQRSQPGASVQE